MSSLYSTGSSTAPRSKAAAHCVRSPLLTGPLPSPRFSSLPSRLTCYVYVRWITNGVFSDYFSVAASTGKGLSVFLVERGEGVETKKISTSYSPSAGTAYITFDNVKVRHRTASSMARRRQAR